MQDKTFKTTAFGGFDKESVLVYLRELLAKQEKEQAEKNQQIEALQATVAERESRLTAEAEKLRLQAEETARLKNSLLLKEDKIASQQQQLEQLRRQMETMQQQARQLIEETNRRCQQQIEQKEAEADQRVENARQNALDLFGKIDEEYRFNRRKYADMVQAINELSKYIEEAQRHANERIAALPESLIGKDRHE